MPKTKASITAQLSEPEFLLGKVNEGVASSPDSDLDADTVDGVEASGFATSAQGSLADTALQPGDEAVTSVNSATGVVTLTTDDVGEGSTNKYYDSVLTNADIDTRVNKSFVDALNVNADTVDDAGLNDAGSGALDLWSAQKISSETVSASVGGTFLGNVTVPNLKVSDGGTIGSVSDADAITVAASGATTFSQLVTASSGISFGAGTLDDYEEGTFAPFYEPESGAFGGGFSYLKQEGKYVRVGAFAFVTLRLVTSNVDLGTAGGDIKVSGLPFAFSDISSPPSTIALGGSATWASNAPTMAQSVGGTNFLNIGRDTTTNLVSTNVSDLNTGGGNENNVQISIFGLIS